MRKTFMKKAVLTGMVLVMSGAATTAAYADWQNSGSQWKYESNGSYLTGWQNINATWYYFDRSGIMMTDWQEIDGMWYYLRADGSMVYDQWIGNYYLGSTGTMLTDAWVGPYYLGSDGAWIPDSQETQNNENQNTDPLYLAQTDPIDKRGDISYGSDTEDTFGNKYKGNSALRLGYNQSATYYADEKYTLLKGTIAPYKQNHSDSECTLEVYADDELIYSSDFITRLTEPEEFEVDIAGAKFVKVRCTTGRVFNYLLLIDGRLE